jgi:competence protein ComEA
LIDGNMRNLIGDVCRHYSQTKGSGKNKKEEVLLMKKKVGVMRSVVPFLLFYAAVIMVMVLATSTDSIAQKKMSVQDITKGASTVIDLNTADEKTLETLPGVGPATAKAIVAGRPYKSIDDLKRVKGMSDKKIAAIQDMVTVGGTTTAAPVAIPSASEAKQKASSTQQSVTEKAEKTKAKLASGQHVNINTATKEELEALPGIGSVKAQAIIDGRPYNAPEDIMKVKGIKQKTFNKIKDYITVK